jgi:hypothetical protein
VTCESLPVATVLKTSWPEHLRFLQGGLHLLSNEAGKWMEIQVDAGTIKSAQILCAVVPFSAESRVFRFGLAKNGDILVGIFP